MPGWALAVNLNTAGSRTNGGRTGQRNRIELVLETRIMISPTVLLDLALKRSLCSTGEMVILPPGFPEQDPRCWCTLVY